MDRGGATEAGRSDRVLDLFLKAGLTGLVMDQIWGAVDII